MVLIHIFVTIGCRISWLSEVIECICIVNHIVREYACFVISEFSYNYKSDVTLNDLLVPQILKHQTSLISVPEYIVIDPR